MKMQLHHHRNKLHKNKIKKIFEIVVIFYNSTVFYFIFDEINPALGEHNRILPTPNGDQWSFFLIFRNRKKKCTLTEVVGGETLLRQVIFYKRSSHRSKSNTNSCSETNVCHDKHDMKCTFAVQIASVLKNKACFTPHTKAAYIYFDAHITRLLLSHCSISSNV